MNRYVFGIDLGGTTVKMGLFETSGELVEKWEIPTDTTDDGSHIVDDIARAVKKKLSEKGINREEVEGIGIDVPGPVLDNGKVLGCVNLGWGEVNIEKEMSQATGFKVKSGNDANVAALGELWYGGGIGYKNMVMVTLGTGVGGGIIIDRRIVYGSHGAGGEIGHIAINPHESKECSCGNKGCLEQYCAIAGIIRTAEEALAEDDAPSSLRGVKLDPKVIFDAAREGDDIALKVVDKFAARMGRSLAIIAAVVDPQVFVIGGGISRAGSVILDPIKEYYRKYAFHACRDAEFKLAKLGNDAGIYGAARLIINR